MKSLTSIFVFVSLLAGCQTGTGTADENSPFYLVPVGSRLVLHKEIEVPAHRAGVYFQGGKILPHAELRVYYPHCRLELRHVPERPLVIRPDEFVVTGSLQDDRLHSVRGPVRLAAGPGFRMTRAGDDGGPTVQTLVTRLDLRSDRQPDVFRLNCGQWGYLPDAGHVSVREIRQALGSFFTLLIHR